MAFNKKQYDQKFAKEHYDRIALNVNKGEKENIAKRAQAKGFKSITDYIKDLIYNDMKNGQNNIVIGEINQTGDSNSIQF
ncbi:MAG: hypothetical protein K2H41_12610 [Acetatifactor sp.]|nr:hypothetical protein [Acetatifactor sp.]